MAHQRLANNSPQPTTPIWLVQPSACWQQSGPSSPRVITGQLHTSIRDGAFEGGAATCKKSVPIYPFPSH
jgi:hypothetical protein